MWSFISSLGLRKSVCPHLAKRIVITNQLAFTIALITTPYIFIFSLAGSFVLGALVTFVVLGYLLVLFVNAKGYYTVARYVMLSAGWLAVSSYAVVIGEASGIALYFLAILCFPFILFEPGKRINIVASLAITVALYISINVLGNSTGPLVEFSPLVLKIIFHSIVFSTAATIVAALTYLYVVNHQKERDLERANQAKSNFLATMSHEIRTPAGVIVGFSELISSGDLPAREIQNATQIIHRNAGHLMDLIDGILDVSKIEANEVAPIPSHFDLLELIREVVQMLEVNAKDKGLQVAIEDGADLIAVLYTDKTRMRQILLNLLSNAIKFTESGKVTINVKTLGDQVCIDLIDSGVGMDEEQVSKLFAPFSQVGDFASRKEGGAGLGLYLSRGLAQVLGGDVTLISSSPSRGSHFQVCVATRLFVNGDGKDNGTSERGVSDVSQLRDVKLLLVEDNVDSRDLLQRILAAEGAQVSVAEDGMAAIKMAEAMPFDVILMDIQMPVLDGYRATERIREKGFNGPIIAITAHALKENRDRCLEAGCSDFLSKPIKPEELIRVVLNSIGNSNSH